MRFKTILCVLILSVSFIITVEAQFTSGSGITYTPDKVGIGTSIPSAKLDVKGSGRFTDAATASSGTGLELDYMIPSDYARILAYDRTNGAYKSLKINGSVLTLNDLSNGNVGIGTGTPGVKLEVKGSGRFTDAGAASSGIGLELDYIVASDYGRILSYDRTNGGYKPLRINGASLFLNDASKGNVSIGAVSAQGALSAFQVHQSNVLGSTQGNFIDISTLSGTGGIANRLMSKLWVVRDNAGSDWTTARLHEGVTIDASFTTPMVDTRTWWERDPYNNIQSWGTGGNTYMTINTGKIGIGTISPATALDVIGTIRSTTLLSNISSVSDNLNYDGKSFNHYSLGWLMDSWNSGGATAWMSAFGGIKFFTGGQPRLFIDANGNAGIGTSSINGYKLVVEGTVGARKIKVTSSTTWADYVFDKDYKLPSLIEVESYINQNKHLPGVPSAKEVAANGVDIGDTQAVLLKKIEELTLYSIEQNKKIEQQRAMIDVQNKKIISQEEKLASLENQLKELIKSMSKTYH